MGKIKTTRTSILNAYAPNYIFKTGYCNLQALFYYDTPKAYTCGVYGWNMDLYDFDGVGITTGYRGMVGNPIDFELVKKYEKQAEHIVYASGKDMTWDEKREKIKELQKEFIKEIKDSIKK